VLEGLAIWNPRVLTPLSSRLGKKGGKQTEQAGTAKKATRGPPCQKRRMERAKKDVEFQIIFAFFKL
jgi:hypothetical protein